MYEIGDEVNFVVVGKKSVSNTTGEYGIRKIHYEVMNRRSYVDDVPFVLVTERSLLELLEKWGYFPDDRALESA